MVDVTLTEGEVVDSLQKLRYANLHHFDSADNVKALRSRFRYLAAFYPDAPLGELAQKVASLVGHRDLSLSDVRVILDGRSLGDASKVTAEVPLAAIQKVGAMLVAGVSKEEAARKSGVGLDTVQAIDRYCGLCQVAEDRRMDLAVISVREGWSVRKLAKVSGLSKSRAHRYQQRARSVLVELKEVQ